MIYNQSVSIPQEIWGDVSDVVQATYGTMNIPEAHWNYMFEVYNRYIAPEDEPQDITCHDCRYTVLKNLRNFVKVWNEKGAITGS